MDEIVFFLYSIIAFIISFSLAYAILPRYIQKMRELKRVGCDVNKIKKKKVPELGGLVSLFSFLIAMFIISGIASASNIHEEIVIPLQIATMVFFAASVIGVIHDIGLLSRWKKAFFVGFAAFPLLFIRPISPQIDLQFFIIKFSGYRIYGIDVLLIIFWFLIIPFGILACANAFNMSAGYNGMESGIPIIASFFYY